MNKEVIFSKIIEEDQAIIFDPPLKIDVYWGEIINECTYYLDFGMSFDYNFHRWFTKKYENDIDKIIRILEFELFHTFFHPQEDPNYSVLNWALYGNLKNRVKLTEQNE